MSIRQVHDDNVVKLFDTKTGKVIHNPTRELAQKASCKRNHLCVVDANPQLGNDILSLVDDMPSAREVPRLAKLFTQRACWIAAKLHEGQDPIVYCKNSRTRSPSVIVAFFMLFRGVPLDFCSRWFKDAYPQQRPKTNQVSVSFPNLERFGSVLEHIQELLESGMKGSGGFCLERTISTCSKKLLGDENALTLSAPMKNLKIPFPILVDGIPDDLPPSAFSPWAGRKPVFEKLQNKKSPIVRITRARRKQISKKAFQAFNHPTPKIKVEPGLQSRKRIVSVADPTKRENAKKRKCFNGKKRTSHVSVAEDQEEIESMVGMIKEIKESQEKGFSCMLKILFGPDA